MLLHRKWSFHWTNFCFVDLSSPPPLCSCPGCSGPVCTSSCRACSFTRWWFFTELRWLSEYMVQLGLHTTAVYVWFRLLFASSIFTHLKFLYILCMILLCFIHSNHYDLNIAVVYCFVCWHLKLWGFRQGFDWCSEPLIHVSSSALETFSLAVLLTCLTTLRCLCVLGPNVQAWIRVFSRHG